MLFNLGGKKEEKEVEAAVEEPMYSVLIHFTKRKDYVYFIKENSIFSNDDGSVYFEDEEGMNVEVRGDYVYRNEFETKDQAENFVYDFKLDNPIVLNY